MTRATVFIACCLALAVSACGGNDKPAPTPTPASAVQQAADLAAIKTYLLEHTKRLNTSVAALQRDAQAYYDLTKSVDFDYARLLNDKRQQTAAAVKAIQSAHIK